MIATTIDNGNSNMTAQTGSTYISGTNIDSVEIPTACKSGVSNYMTSSTATLLKIIVKIY